MVIRIDLNSTFDSIIQGAIKYVKISTFLVMVLLQNKGKFKPIWIRKNRTLNQEPNLD